MQDPYKFRVKGAKKGVVMEERNIILASRAKVRINTLYSLGIIFKTVPADIDEKAIRDPDFRERALNLARAKSNKIAENNHGIIISADGFFVLNGKELEKPRTREEAREMIGSLSGSVAEYITGFCYRDTEEDILFEKIFSTKIKYRKFDKEEIDALSLSDEVVNYAAGLYNGGVYEKTLVEKIDGSLSSFLCFLPLETLIPLLRKSGVKIPVSIKL